VGTATLEDFKDRPVPVSEAGTYETVSPEQFFWNVVGALGLGFVLGAAIASRRQAVVEQAKMDHLHGTRALGVRRGRRNWPKNIIYAEPTSRLRVLA
jgi:hypothetical protein